MCLITTALIPLNISLRALSSYHYYFLYLYKRCIVGQICFSHMKYDVPKNHCKFFSISISNSACSVSFSLRENLLNIFAGRRRLPVNNYNYKIKIKIERIKLLGSENMFILLYTNRNFSKNSDLSQSPGIVHRALYRTQYRLIASYRGRGKAGDPSGGYATRLRLPPMPRNCP